MNDVVWIGSFSAAKMMTVEDLIAALYVPDQAVPNATDCQMRDLFCFCGMTQLRWQLQNSLQRECCYDMFVLVFLCQWKKLLVVIEYRSCTKS